MKTIIRSCDICKRILKPKDRIIRLVVEKGDYRHREVVRFSMLCSDKCLFEEFREIDESDTSDYTTLTADRDWIQEEDAYDNYKWWLS